MTKDTGAFLARVHGLAMGYTFKTGAGSFEGRREVRWSFSWQADDGGWMIDEQMDCFALVGKWRKKMRKV